MALGDWLLGVQGLLIRNWMLGQRAFVPNRGRKAVAHLGRFKGLI